MMKIFKRDKSKKYVCDVCSKQFNWDKNSSCYGQLGEKPEAIVCSDKCKERYK